MLGISLILAVAAIALKSLTQKQAPPAVTTGQTSAPAPSGADDTQTLNAQQRKEIEDALDAASQYMNTDHLPEAETILKALIAKYPDHPDVLRQMSGLHMLFARTVPACECFDHMLELHGGSAADYHHAGVLANMIGNLDLSRQRFETACRMNPSEPEHFKYLAMIEMKQYDYAAAKAHLVQAATMNDADEVIWGTLGEIAFLENHLDIGMQHTKKARALNPANLKWRLIEARILRRQNKPDEAITLLSALTKPDSVEQGVINEIALCWAMKGDPLHAAQIHIDYVNSNARNRRVDSPLAAARYLMQADDLGQARVWVQNALNRDPTNEEAQNLLDQLNKQ
ncbi:MAG: hypothetical protein D8M59_10235 [Planctomycetes bacterium]|nr:hypothetical protein [Planctomycetota bacterium]